MIEQIEQIESGEPQIWERLEGETDKQWAAFRIYRDLPPQDRSVVQAFIDYVDVSGLKPLDGRPRNAPGYFCAWSSENSWVDRVRAYDRFRDAKAVAHAEIDHMRKLNDYRGRLLDYAEISTKNGIEGMQMIKRSIDAIAGDNGKGVVPPHILPKFIQAVAKLFESAAAQESKALAVDKLLEVIGGESGPLH